MGHRWAQLVVIAPHPSLSWTGKFGQDLALVSSAKSCPKSQRFLTEDNSGATVGHGWIVIANTPLPVL